MKQIQPVTIWYNGIPTPANIFSFYSSYDNLNNSCTFCYALYDGTLDELGTKIATGTINMDGQDYIDYSSSPDSNTFAYNWGATKLNLTIIS